LLIIHKTKKIIKPIKITIKSTLIKLKHKTKTNDKNNEDIILLHDEE